MNKLQRPCSVTVKGDDLVLLLDYNKTITVERRGRCRTRSIDGVLTKSCNIKLGWADDFVYGLIVQSGVAGTRISSPQIEIKIPDLNFTDDGL